MNDSLTLYKLIILYMLKKVDFPMTTSQISEFILGQGYTNYFKIQECLSEMKEDQLVHTETTHNRTLYHLAENGDETLLYFQKKIPEAIQHDIDHFLEEKEYDLKEEVAAKANYYRNTQHEYDVHFQLTESRSNLVDLTLTVPTETEAEAMVNNWYKNYQEIYTLLMTKLL